MPSSPTNMRSNRTKSDVQLIVSIDDFHESNVELARRMKGIGVVATFFVELITPGARAQVKELHELGMAIGSHTLSHPGDIKSLPAEECRAELEVSKRIIEEITGEPCLALAYPRGRHNEDVVEMVRAAGYEEARTTHVLKTKTEDPYRTPTTIHVYDGRKEYNGRPWMAMADFYLDHVKKTGGFFHIWGHVREMERDRQVEPFPAWL